MLVASREQPPVGRVHRGHLVKPLGQLAQIEFSGLDVERHASGRLIMLGQRLDTLGRLALQATVAGVPATQWYVGDGIYDSVALSDAVSAGTSKLPSRETTFLRRFKVFSDSFAVIR